MALRTIVLDGDPILKKKCREVTKFDDKLASTLDDMHETMLHANGVGLAAPQVGFMRRFFVVLDDRDRPEDPQEEYEPTFIDFINPEILETSGHVKDYEGCLSYMGRNAAIVRPQKVKVRAFDRHGEEFTMEVEDFMARCICHENDHLNGVTIIDLAEYYFEDEDRPHELDK